MKDSNIQKLLREAFQAWNADGAFSGVFSVSGPDGAILEEACGFRNRAEALPNQLDTGFGIASGTKFFTALAVCELADRGYLALEDRICDLIAHDLKGINREVTVYHLLTHTSGIGDYIDEEASDDYFDMLRLYDRYPVHRWDALSYYLPMFNELPPKFPPGERFGYSNAGFILLGLVIEGVTKMAYQQYVTESIIAPLGLSHTGFYPMNRLPGNTALGYISREAGREYETNVLYMPIIGGSDGGLFTCAADLVTLWNAVFSGCILSADMRARVFAPQVPFGAEGPVRRHCGLGVFLREQEEKRSYFIVGGDFGVDFFSSYFPRKGMVASALGNTEMDTGPLLKRLLAILG